MSEELTEAMTSRWAAYQAALNRLVEANRRITDSQEQLLTKAGSLNTQIQLLADASQERITAQSELVQKYLAMVQWVQSIVMGVALAAGVLIAWGCYRSVNSPLSALVTQLRAIQEGKRLG